MANDGETVCGDIGEHEATCDLDDAKELAVKHARRSRATRWSWARRVGGPCEWGICSFHTGELLVVQLGSVYSKLSALVLGFFM